MINWSGLVNWCGMVYWSWFMDWSRSITWFSFVYNFHYVSRVAISSIVFDNLSSAIRKVNLVFSVGGISITCFLLAIVTLACFPL